MPRKAPDPELVAETLALVAAGVSISEAARTAGVTEGAVRQWIKKAKVAPAPSSAPSAPPPAPIPDHMAPPAPVEAVEVGHDMVAGVRAMMNRALQRSAAAEAAGNYAAAQRDSRDASAMAIVLARLTRSEAEDKDILRISRSEVSAIEDSLRDRISAILSRPLLCAECSRALSISWGTGGVTHEDPNVTAKAR